MVLFNHSTRELTAKIVYYGPGLCGKTTNLRLLHEKLDQATTGRLLSLSTAQDRTIYFDLLPVELGNVKGYTVRFQLCTVPGQVFYNETRKLVLKGADGIVFVVDSQWSMLSHNLESFQNLRENMAELGQSLDEAAVVIQYNKRDLPGVLSVQALQESLGFQEFPFVESIAADAKGVVETFKLVSKLTFIHILKRLQRSPDGEKLGPDWVAPNSPNSQSTLRVAPVSAQLLALTSTVGPAPAPPTDSPFETTASWPGLEKGEVFGESTIPPFPVEHPPEPESVPPAPEKADDTLTEPPLPLPAAAEPEPDPEPLPEMSLEAVPEPEPEPTQEQGPEPQPEAEPEPVPEPEPEPTPSQPEPVPAEPPPPAIAEAQPPPPPPTATVWAEAFAGLTARLDEMTSARSAELAGLSARFDEMASARSEELAGLCARFDEIARARTEESESLSARLDEIARARSGEAESLSARLDEMARAHGEESARVEALARETREAVDAVPATVKDALSALAPTSAVTALHEALEKHTDEIRPKLLGLIEEAARQREAIHERGNQEDDAARDSARRHREEIRGDVERAAAAVREVVEALEGRVVELRTSLEERLALLEAAISKIEASDRLEDVRRETLAVKRLVETKLDEAGGQSRRLSGFLRRALEELEPPDKG